MDIKRVAINAVNEVIVMNVPPMEYNGQVTKESTKKCHWQL